MGRIGDTLRETRESKNLSLRDAEEATKIRLKYLKDLENENFESLPGRAYVIGFLKTYAKYLQIEDQALVEEYKATNRSDEYSHSQRNKSSDVKNAEINSQPKLQSILVVGVAILLLLGTNFLYGYIGGRNANEPDEPLIPDVITEEPDLNEDNEPDDHQVENTETADQESPPPVLDKIQVSIKISEAENSACWVNVISDNRTIFSGTMTAGEEKNFEARDNLEVKLGNAGVAYIVANGEDLGVLGTKGAVVTKTFEKDAL